MKTLFFYALMSLSGLNPQGYQTHLPEEPQQTVVLTNQFGPTTLVITEQSNEVVHLITISGRVDLGTTIIPVSVTVTAPSREQAEIEARKAILVMKNIFEQI